MGETSFKEIHDIITSLSTSDHQLTHYELPFRDVPTVAVYCENCRWRAVSRASLSMRYLIPEVRQHVGSTDD